MKTIRREYPRVRQYVKSGNTYFSVDLRRKHYQGPKWKNFTDRQPALTYAASIGDKVAKEGLNSISVIGADPRVAAWTEQFAIYGKTLEEAVETALVVFEKERQTKESPYMAELLSVWVDDKITNTLKPLRPKTLKSIRNMANLFKEDFGMIRMKEIDQDRIEDYLRNKDVSNQTRKNMCSYLGQFFNWAKSKKYHDQNPSEFIEIHVENGTPEFFTVAQCEEMMKEVLKAENRSMTAYFALCLFGGIRPEEVERMNWEKNIKMDTREIFLPSTITKTKRDRLFLMSDNLFQWLQNCREIKPLVPPANVKNLRVKVCKGLTFGWVQDGLRHTFATFHYAKDKNLETLRQIMGNSPNIIEKFYKGVITAAEVSKFWGIVPTMEKI